MIIAALARGGEKQIVSIFREGHGQNHKSTPGWRYFWFALAMFSCVAAPLDLAAADSFGAGTAAYRRHDYGRAASIFLDLAALGDARAQTYLGYMYAQGLGVPQNYIIAAGWRRCASQQGVPSAQYFLGLQYDKGQGVPQDYVAAYALLNLAVAGAGPERHYWVKVRDAISSKLTLIQKLQGQELAFLGPPQTPCLPIVAGY